VISVEVPPMRSKRWTARPVSGQSAAGLEHRR
jgi:hypothetical protein